MKKLILLLIGLFLFTNLVYAFDCQYSENETKEFTTTLYYINNQKVNITPPFVNIMGVRSWKEWIGYTMDYEFYIQNNIPFPLEITVYYNVEGKQNIQEVMLDPYGKYRIKGEYDQANPGLDVNSIYYEIKNLNKQIKKYDKVIQVCKQCLGKICLNDGESCSSSNECGGGFCIEGHCSNTEYCSNNDCHCNSDEIQCSNNKQCVKKSVVPLDVKPKCGLYEECNSSYLNRETGLCAKSPAKIQEENEKRKKFYLFLGIGFVLLFVIGIFIFYSYKNKSKKLDIEKIEAEYKKKQYEIEQKNKDIEELKAKSHKTKKESKRLKNLSSELTEQIAHFEKTSKKFLIKKYTERYGNKIYLDTKKDYFRFKSNNEFLHRYIYKSFYKNFNEANEVHHIDANHYNNEIWNLIALTPEQHRKIKHGKILYGDWISGINELRRIGFSDEDLPSEVIKRLRNQ